MIFKNAKEAIYEFVFTTLQNYVMVWNKDNAILFRFVSKNKGYRISRKENEKKRVLPKTCKNKYNWLSKSTLLKFIYISFYKQYN